MEHVENAPLQAYETGLAFTWNQLQKLTMPRLLPLKALSHLRGSETSQDASADHAWPPIRAKHLRNYCHVRPHRGQWVAI